ncbi:phage FluMu protein Com [Bradyrhizobium sp. USDA 4341]
MGSKSPDTLWGGRIIGAKMRAESAKRESAEKLKESHAETCRAWNYRMLGYGGPAQPSPTIAEAVSGGFPYLEVKCRRCATLGLIDLSVVNDVRRSPGTPIWKLEASLRCRHCTTGSPNGRWKPAANLVRLRSQPTLDFEPWYSEEERSR